MYISMVIGIIIGNVFVNNFTLSRFLGMCPFVGVSKESKAALSMGIAVTFVMAVSSMITWFLYYFVLQKFHIEFLATLSFILVIAVFVQLVEMVILKFSPGLHKVLGIYLPLITTNCAVLGVAVLNINMFFSGKITPLVSFSNSVLQGFFGGVGFTLAIMLMSAIRERLRTSDIPNCLKGAPIAFIIASLMSMAFIGFAGLKF